ncbi:MAG: hypothetical protein H0Z40_01345 [Desulfotomaculum sp.]|nr:hypothetical protein [Desulfotomaculum sp.]
MADLQIAQNNQSVVMEVDGGTPQEMAMRLADMKSKLGLVQKFFKEVMVKDQDYGVIPGTDKPTLLKPGAEKLCELYGYAPVVKQVDELSDKETGFYRARVTVALIHRRTGITIAEGVGEANTNEGRYRWRWVPEWKLPPGIDKESLYCEERTGRNGKYLMYRIENEDPWTLWNTVLKMAKKRALVDAALSATRSSGLFTQDVEDLQAWASAENYSAVESYPTTQAQGSNQSSQNNRAKRNNQGPRNPDAPSSEAQQKAIYAIASKKGLDNGELKLWLSDQYGTEHTSELTMGQASECINYLQDTDPEEIKQKVVELSGQTTMFGDEEDKDDVPF